LGRGNEKVLASLVHDALIAMTTAPREPCAVCEGCFAIAGRWVVGVAMEVGKVERKRKGRLGTEGE